MTKMTFLSSDEEGEHSVENFMLLFCTSCVQSAPAGFPKRRRAVQGGSDMSLRLGCDLSLSLSVRIERWSLLCLEVDLRQKIDCEETQLPRRQCLRAQSKQSKGRVLRVAIGGNVVESVFGIGKRLSRCISGHF